MTTIGAFDPAGTLHGIAIEMVFVDGADCGAGRREVARIFAAGRIPLVTVEPWHGADPASWGLVFAAFRPEPVYVRYMHEPNGTWYPWSSRPARFRQEWARWTAAMPGNVRNVFCPNVDYADAPHRIAHYRPDDAATVHVVGIDGYARNGETPAELFRPTLDNLRWFYDAPLWICETAAPRGRQQARYAEALVAFAAQQGIEAVLWFNTRKEGVDEADWSLTPAAERALLGDRSRSPKRKRSRAAA